jgi:hypothetical protein
MKRTFQGRVCCDSHCDDVRLRRRHGAGDDDWLELFHGGRPIHREQTDHIRVRPKLTDKADLKVRPL